MGLHVITPIILGTMWVGEMVLILLMKGSVRLGGFRGHVACAWPWTQTQDPLSLMPKLLVLHIHVCAFSLLPLPQLLGRVGGEGKRALGIFIFILCYLSHINSVEKAKWAQYHIVFELLTTILILTRKEISFGRIKAPHSHSTLLLLKKKKKEPCNSVPIILHCKVMRN